MSKNVDVLSVMDCVLGDLMAAQVAGFETETLAPDVSSAIDSVSKLIQAAVDFEVGEYHDNETESHIDYRERRRSERANLRAAIKKVRGLA